MNPCCDQWEDLLLRFDELDSGERGCAQLHLARCSQCREFHHALGELDGELTTALGEVEPTPAFDTRVRARCAHPAVPPRLWLSGALDGIGWSSLIVLLIWLGLRLSPAWLQTGRLVDAGLLLAVAALVFGIRSAVSARP